MSRNMGDSKKQKIFFALKAFTTYFGRQDITNKWKANNNIEVTQQQITETIIKETPA